MGPNALLWFKYMQKHATLFRENRTLVDETNPTVIKHTHTHLRVSRFKPHQVDPTVRPIP